MLVSKIVEQTKQKVDKRYECELLEEHSEVEYSDDLKLKEID